MVVFHYSFFLLFIKSCFLIPAFITQFFNPIAELVIPIVMPTKDVKADMETHPVNVEINKNKCSIKFETL